MYLAYNWRRFAVFQFLLASSALQHCKVFEITDLVLLKFPLPDSFPSMQLSPTNYIRLVVTGYVPTNGQFVAVNFRPLLLLSVENACFAVSHNFTNVFEVVCHKLTVHMIAPQPRINVNTDFNLKCDRLLQFYIGSRLRKWKFHFAK